MATVNPWVRFKRLMPRAGRYTVTITNVSQDGTSTATRRDGKTVRLKGGLVAAGGNAWVDGEQIIGEAPNLPSGTQYV